MSKRKRRRGKRVFPVRYASDYINTNRGPRSLDLDYKYSEGDHWFNNQGRVRSVKGPKHQKEPVFNNTFQQDIPHTGGRIHHSYWDEKKQCLVQAEPTPKMEVQYLERQWADKVGPKWGVDHYHYIIHSRTVNRVLKLFFCCNSFYWLEEFRSEGWFRRSQEYVGKAQAMRVYERERITWVTKERLLST